MTHDDAKKKLILAGQVLVDEGQDDFTRGHISVRLPDDPEHFFMKPHSVGLDEITLANILTIDLAGNVVAGTARGTARSTSIPRSTRRVPMSVACCTRIRPTRLPCRQAVPR